MAAFDFPSSPSVNQTYTANGVTWKWNGTMWMRVSGAGYLEKIEEGNSKIEIDDSGSGNVSITTDGTERLRIRSDGKLMTQSAGYVYTASSAGSLSLYGGNTNLGGGIILGGGNGNADIRFLAQASTATPAERLRIKSNGAAYFTGNLGLGGQTSPSATIHINDLSANGYELKVTGNAVQFNRSSISYIDQLHNSGSILFRMTSSNTEAMRITSAGRVGINQSTPQTTFHSTGTTNGQQATFGIDDSGLKISTFQKTDNDAGVILDAQKSSNGTLTFATAGTERLRITSGGNVGVNVINPLSDLHVITAGQTEDGRFRIGGNAASLGLVLDYDQSSATVSRITANPTYTNTSSLLKICVDGDANPNQLVLKGDGKIGFNAASPPRDYCFHSGQADTNIQITNNTTGIDDSAGALIQQDGNDLYIWNKENSFMSLGTNAAERFRITSAGHKWTNNGSIFHGSNDITDFTQASRDSYNNISVRAGRQNAGTSPTNDNSAIKIYPAGVRSSTTGNLTGGIAWQHLDPNNSSWGSSYGAGSQIWMGAALHDTPGQERDRFNLWMNNSTVGNSNPNNLAIEAYPNGVVRHPKVPAFMVRNSTNSGAFSSEARATWNVTILNNGSHFDMTNNVFTAPVDGIYNFSCMMLSQNNTRLFHNFRVNNTIIEGTRSESYSGTSYQTNTITMTYQLSANDYVDVYVRNNSGYGGNYTNFNGFLVG